VRATGEQAGCGGQFANADQFGDHAVSWGVTDAQTPCEARWSGHLRMA